MRIPLIVAASSEGMYPFVYLKPGRWTFESDAIDSVVMIECPPLPAENYAAASLDLAARTPVRAILISRGSERAITVYACLST